MSSAEKSVLTVLFSINIELINILSTEISLTALFTGTISYLNFFVALSLNCIATTLGCVICEFFIAISIMKILLVTHFEWIFPFDPCKVGKIILIIAVVVAVLPCVAVTTYESQQQHVTTQTVAYLSGMIYCYQGLPFLQRILGIWILLTIFTVVSTLLYLNRHLKQRRISQAIQAGESNVPGKDVNLKKILLVTIGVLCHVTIAVINNFLDQNKSLPIVFFSSTISLNMALIYFIAEDNVWRFVKKKLPQRLLKCVALIKTTKISPEPYYIQV